MNASDARRVEPIATEGPGLPPPRGPWKMLWLRLRKNRIAMTGGLILIFLYFISCFAAGMHGSGAMAC
ncbi:MAG: hypothetical protein ACO4CW_12835, partial [Planctomycetota bacterium]